MGYDRRGSQGPPLPADDTSSGAVVWRRVLWGWMGSQAGQSRLRVYEDGEDRWVVYCRLGERPGTSPVTTLAERFASAEAAMRAAEDYLAASQPAG
jgi:hypothetical protein